MASKIDALRDRLDGARLKGSKTMWYMLFANAIADRLCETGTIARDDMLAIFQMRIEAARSGPEAGLLVPGYEGCIARLGDLVGERKLENGYEPTGL